MYAPDTAAVSQRSNWTCSAASTAWALNSLGLPVSEQDVVDWFGPDRINASLGLLDGSGAGIVAALADHGVNAANAAVSFDDVYALAGQQPVIIGGAGIYHWVGVRATDGDALSLANPAPNWRGVGQRLTRADFDADGPWFAVVFANTGTNVTPGLPVVGGLVAWVTEHPWLVLAGAAAAVVALIAPHRNPAYFWTPDGVRHDAYRNPAPEGANQALKRLEWRAHKQSERAGGCPGTLQGHHPRYTSGHTFECLKASAHAKLHADWPAWKKNVRTRNAIARQTNSLANHEARLEREKAALNVRELTPAERAAQKREIDAQIARDQQALRDLPF